MGTGCGDSGNLIARRSGGKHFLYGNQLVHGSSEPKYQLSPWSDSQEALDAETLN